VRVIVAVSLSLLVLLRVTNFITDIAIVTVTTLVLAFIAAASVVVWFIGFSGYPAWSRKLTAGVLVTALLVLVVCFRIEGVSGSLIPRFVFRFAPDRDYALGEAVAEAGEPINMVTTTPYDFPGFLGPERNAIVRSVRLARDWSARPPQLVWRRKIGAGWSGFAVVNGFAVTLEQRGERELVTCYEALTGKLRWSHAESGRHSTSLGGVGPRSTPSIHNGRVFVTTVAGVVLCLEGATGDVLWRVDLVELLGSDAATEKSQLAWGRAGSPLVVDDLLIVPGGGRPEKAVSLLALRQSDGEVVWRAGDKQISYASPTLATLCGVRQILSVNENNVSAHDPQTGKILWQEHWPGDSSGSASVSQPQTPGGDRVLLSKAYFTGAKLLQVSRDQEKFSTEVLWEEPSALITKFTNAAVLAGRAYALSDGLLECVDIETGDTLWKGKRRGLGDYGQGQLLAVGDVLLIQAEDGSVAMVAAQPDKLQELGSFPALHGQTWNTLTLYGPYLLARNAEEAACYELPTE
jgi:outer membrane protein assembly factor BamB